VTCSFAAGLDMVVCMLSVHLPIRVQIKTNSQTL
jgi:hypothetical protein